jgi:phosphate transport system permease protein
MSESGFETSAYSRRRAVLSRAFAGLCLCATALCVLVLVLLILEILWKGLPWLNVRLLTSFPSVHPEKAGIAAALVSSLWLIVLTALIGVPIGVGAAV